MAIDILQMVNIIEAMENFLAGIRPPEHLRSKLDIGYKIEGQSIIVFELRPQWDNPELIKEHPVAKSTFVNAKNHWKIFWMKADLKWHSYTPKPTVRTIQDFTKIVAEDQHHCFWG
jgi:Protein of unknown function (DUF3024)